MSLYSVEEVCRDCANVMLCTRCGAVEYCSLEVKIDAVTGTCSEKKIKNKENSKLNQN